MGKDADLRPRLSEEKPLSISEHENFLTNGWWTALHSSLDKTVHSICQFSLAWTLQAPATQHPSMLNQVFRYLSTTSNYVISYKKASNCMFICEHSKSQIGQITWKNIPLQLALSSRSIVLQFCQEVFDNLSLLFLQPKPTTSPFHQPTKGIVGFKECLPTSNFTRGWPRTLSYIARQSLQSVRMRWQLLKRTALTRGLSTSMWYIIIFFICVSLT